MIGDQGKGLEDWFQREGALSRFVQFSAPLLPNLPSVYIPLHQAVGFVRRLGPLPRACDSLQGQGIDMVHFGIHLICTLLLTPARI